MMEETYKKLIDGNQIFAGTREFSDPEYFKKLSLSQTPVYLWIGCSDCNVPAHEITSSKNCDLFINRNIANLVIPTDLNMLSVLEYAISYLKVKHVIVCGHYGCGCIKASMTNELHGMADQWLSYIKDIYIRNRQELELIKDPGKRQDRLTELNVIEQVKNLAKTSIVQKAWKERDLHLHGWVYGINKGLITDLCVIHDSQEDLDIMYRYNLA